MQTERPSQREETRWFLQLDQLVRGRTGVLTGALGGLSRPLSGISLSFLGEEQGALQESRAWTPGGGKHR